MRIIIVWIGARKKGDRIGISIVQVVATDAGLAGSMQVVHRRKHFVPVWKNQKKYQIIPEDYYAKLSWKVE